MTHSTNSLNVLRRPFLILFHVCILFSHISTNEVGLRRFLFLKRPYDTKVCPGAGITKVYTNLILLQIESVNEKAQVWFGFSILISYSI
jgi:hypothetical protein